VFCLAFHLYRGDLGEVEKTKRFSAARSRASLGLTICAEGTVCPISFVKDVLVSKLSSPVCPLFSVVGFVPTSHFSVHRLPDSDHHGPDRIPKDHLASAVTVWSCSTAASASK